MKHSIHSRMTGSSMAWMALVASAAAAPQRSLWTEYGDIRRERFGQSVAWLDDLDGDGVRDFAAGAPTWEAWSQPVARHGIVRLCSGADGSLLRELRDDSHHSFGWVVANGGDLDGDGHDDVLVGAPDDGNGAVFAFSSQSGARLLALGDAPPDAHPDLYGQALLSLGLVDGDDVPDFVVGVPGEVVNGLAVGRIELRSGADGALLRSMNGADLSLFGSERQLDAAGDVDGDGAGDLLTAKISFAPDNTPNCDLDVWSGASFANLFHATVTLPQRLQYDHAPCVRAAGDVDGDGTGDFIASMVARIGTVSSRAVVVSGATGATIRVLTGSFEFGERCDGVGDVDGDALAEVAVTLGAIVYGDGDLRLFKGSDGSELRTILEDSFQSHAFATSFDGSVDADGDGVHDLLVGSPPYYDPISHWYGGPGRVQRRSLLDGSKLCARDGEPTALHLAGSALLVDDVDGDGRLDVVVREVDELDFTHPVERFSLRSGADGHELQSTPLATTAIGSYRGALLAIPDIDADGLVDFACAQVGGAWQVELRSGATLQLVRTLALSRSPDGMALAAAVQPATGAVEVAVGLPNADHPLGFPGVGRFAVYDAASGVLRFEVAGKTAFPYENFGSAVAAAGDVDGDGVADWAVGGPGNGKVAVDCGRLSIVSGVDGSGLANVYGAVANQALGGQVAPLADLTGDGLPELAVKSALVSNSGAALGKIELLDGATHAAYATLTGTTAGEYAPAQLLAFPDLDGDGSDDLALVGSGGDLYQFRSGRDLTLIHRVESGPTSLLAPPPAGRTGRIRRGGGPLAVSWSESDTTFGEYAGRLDLIELDDLYLEVAPASAPAGATVEVWVRRGPSALPAALLLESIDGAPVGVLLALDTFDGAGELALDAVIPPGLTGQVWTLRGYAIGWNGKLVISQSATFTFE